MGSLEIVDRSAFEGLIRVRNQLLRHGQGEHEVPWVALGTPGHRLKVTRNS